MIPMPLSLGFSSSDQTSANSGAPVMFGAVSFGGNASGGAAGNYTPDLAGNATSTTVTPQINSLPGAGGGIGGDVLGAAVPAVLGMGMGLNGNQVQSPGAAAMVRQAQQAEAAGEGDGGPGGMFGGFPTIGLIGLAVSGIAVILIMAR